jgi:homocysteine S-methyltransferase
MRPAAAGIPLVARPNAGGPQQVGGRFLYPATPSYFGEHAQALLDEGVALIGGCCGTGPDHVRAVGQALASPRSPAAAVLAELDVEAGPASEGPSRTELEARLSEGRFLVAVELEPPRGYGSARMLAAAETLAEAGADVIDVADSPLARLRMSPWAACRLIEEQVKVETVLHFPTRGRNLLRLQGDLLAVHALGIRNLFVCLGDPVAIGDFPGGTDHVDVAPTGLIRLVTASFNVGRDEQGSSIGEPTSFVVGCAVNPAAADLDREVRLLRRKIEAGAAFALSQPVFEPATLARFRRAFEDRFGELRLPILAGVLPLAGERHATFLHNEVPGMRIPEAVLARLAAAGSHGEAEGLRMAKDLAVELRELASGVYLMPQFGRFDLAAEIVEAVKAEGLEGSGNRPRP